MAISKKSDTVYSVEGRVLKNLSNGFYQVLLENKKVIVACVSGRIRKYSVRILVNDLVDVDMSIYDLNKGRIVARR